MPETPMVDVRRAAALAFAPTSRIRVWAHRYDIYTERDPVTGRLLYDLFAVIRIARATRPERRRRLPADKRSPLV